MRPALTETESMIVACLRRRTRSIGDTDGMSILRWLGLEGAGTATPVDSVSAVEQALAGMDPARARYLACFAFILSRVARADSEVADAELRLMERIVCERGGLPLEQAALVIQIATREGLRHGGTEDFIVTREFAGLADREQKLALLDCLFAVSAVDHSIRTVEDNAIRQIASELRLEHSDFIAARTAHSGHLRVLKKD
jgi:uncharacterized tellurite resistance protein B-like protein